MAIWIGCVENGNHSSILDSEWRKGGHNAHLGCKGIQMVTGPWAETAAEGLMRKVTS